jgi:hypothetical protein
MPGLIVRIVGILILLFIYPILGIICGIALVMTSGTSGYKRAIVDLLLLGVAAWAIAKVLFWLGVISFLGCILVALIARPSAPTSKERNF